RAVPLAPSVPPCGIARTSPGSTPTSPRFPNPTLPLKFLWLELGYILRVSTASPRVTFCMARFGALTSIFRSDRLRANRSNVSFSSTQSDPNTPFAVFTQPGIPILESFISSTEEVVHEEIYGLRTPAVPAGGMVGIWNRTRKGRRNASTQSFG